MKYKKKIDIEIDTIIKAGKEYCGVNCFAPYPFCMLFKVRLDYSKGLYKRCPKCKKQFGENDENTKNN